jgi:multidrug efflux pump subunit AcrB
MVDLDPAKLLAKGLTPLDVVNAVNAQNLTLPSGTAKIGDTQYTVRTNAIPETIDELNNIPVKFANGATVFVKDVGYVRDGSLVQQNVVRADGRRSVLLSVINGNASTVDVVREVKKAPTSPARRLRPAWRSRSCSTNRCSSAPRSIPCCARERSPPG